MPFLAPLLPAATATTGTAAAASATAAAGASASAAASRAGILGSLASIYNTMQPVLTGLSIISPFIAMGSSAALAAQQIALANSQASLTEYEIKNMEQASALRSSERKKQFRKAIGTQLTLYGNSGVDVTQGTPVDVMQETAKDFATESYLDSFETQNRIYSNMIRAKNQRAYGRQQATGTLLNYAMQTAERGVPFSLKPTTPSFDIDQAGRIRGGI